MFIYRSGDSIEKKNKINHFELIYIDDNNKLSYYIIKKFIKKSLTLIFLLSESILFRVLYAFK